MELAANTDSIKQVFYISFIIMFWYRETILGRGTLLSLSLLLWAAPGSPLCRGHPSGMRPPTRAYRGSWRNPPVSGYSLGKYMELYTAQNTKIRLDTTSFWRLAEYRKWFFSLLPQTANHKDTTNFKREEQTFSSLDLFQLRDVFDNLLETSKNRQRNFPKLLPLFILLYHLAWPSSFPRAAVCLHVIIAHVKAAIFHSKICPKYLGVKCELLELKIIKCLWFTIY